MKKIFSKEIFFTLFFILTLFVSVNKVSADTAGIPVDYGGEVSSSSDVYAYNYSQMKSLYEDYSDIILTIFETWYNEYTQYYSIDYPYYWLSLDDNYIEKGFNIRFYAGSEIPHICIGCDTNAMFYNVSASATYSSVNETLEYNTPACSGVDNSNYYLCQRSNSSYISGVVSSVSQNHIRFYSDRYFFSNFDYAITSYPLGYSSYVATSYTNSYTKAYRYHQEWSAPSVIPTFYDFFNLTFLNDYKTSDYTEVNLNNYAYVILSLKSYDTLISPVEFYSKGQACITPVYNYGTLQKPSVTDVCFADYSNFTVVRYYIKNTDLSNHTVWYIAPYDVNQENKIRINTNVFDISYISSVNANNPTIEVNGHVYSPIPYDSLSTTAQSNEANGYIPGQTCAVGDPDCLYSNSGIDIDNLFTHPLQLLQSLWGSITQFFTIVAVFMTVLPTELQTFLYVGFMLAVVIGIIKIIIG